MELRDGLDTEARGKSFSSTGDQTPVVQSVVNTILTELLQFFI
jgi:hypothetical protein